MRGSEVLLTCSSTTLNLLSPKVHYSDIQLLNGKRTDRVEGGVVVVVVDVTTSSPTSCWVFRRHFSEEKKKKSLL